MHWVALQASPEADTPLVDPAAALGWWALRFTPRAVRVGHAVLLETSASERLFGGRRALLQALLGDDAPVQPLHHARGATGLVALGRLRAARGTRASVDELPLQALDAAAEHLDTLKRIGCTRWGQLRALPRDGVSRRFGGGLLQALDQAYGERPEAHEWLAPPEVFDMKLDLGALVEAAPALLFGARRLLGQLQAWLRPRQQGVLVLRLDWFMDPRRSRAGEGGLELRTAEPTQDMGHLQRLLAEHLARVTLPAPVHGLRMVSLDTAALAGASLALIPDDLHRGDSLHQTLERLSARLGPARVLRAVACADHRPERMQRWQAALATPVPAGEPARPAGLAGSDEGYAGHGALYPTWLLPSPLKLSMQGDLPYYQGPLTLLTRAQRLEAGWWDLRTGRAAGLDAAAQLASAAALRDYFIAHSPQAGLLWIYRERLPGRRRAPQGGKLAEGWYLHGLFA